MLPVMQRYLLIGLIFASPSLYTTPSNDLIVPPTIYNTKWVYNPPKSIQSQVIERSKAVIFANHSKNPHEDQDFYAAYYRHFNERPNLMKNNDLRTLENIINKNLYLESQ